MAAALRSGRRSRPCRKATTGICRTIGRSSRTLTMNLGVRFEYTTPWKDRYYHLDYFSATTPDPVTGTPGSLVQTTPSHPYPSNSYQNWGPRVGLAWSFLPNTVFRAGYGLFYAPGAAVSDRARATSAADRKPPPISTSVKLRPRPARRFQAELWPIRLSPALLSYPNALVGSGISSIFPSWQTPMNQMWNANIQHTVTKNLLLEVAYVGSRGEHLWNNFTRGRHLSAVSFRWAPNSITWFPTRTSARSPADPERGDGTTGSFVNALSAVHRRQPDSCLGGRFRSTMA